MRAGIRDRQPGMPDFPIEDMMLWIHFVKRYRQAELLRFAV
jgi:hypothetical protein